MHNEDFDFAVAQTITDISLSGATHFFEPIVGELEKLKATFGKTLRATAIGRDQAPVFGGANLEWAALTDAWMRRKRTYPRAAFYRGLSPTEDSLAKALFSLPVENLFGRTTLRTRLEQVETAGFYNPRIKKQIQTVFRDDYGRFARANEQARRNVRVVVNPFPNIEYGDSESLIQALPISDKNKTKLFANDEKRPLIEPYTEWFFTRKLRAKIFEYAEKLR